MAESEDTPHARLDQDTGDDKASSIAQELDKDDHKPRDSKGWDGKLRVDKLALTDEPRDPHAQIESDPEVSEDEGPPPEQLPADEDLLDDVPEDEDEIELVHCKIADMDSLRLERFKNMKVRSLVCRHHNIPLTTLATMSSSEPPRSYQHTLIPRIHPHRSRLLR